MPPYLAGVHVSPCPHIDGYSVHPLYTGVDRTDVGGWAVPSNRADLVYRLAAAILAGAAFKRVELRTDVNGQTYYCATHAISARHYDTDLAGIGF